MFMLRRLRPALGYLLLSVFLSSQPAGAATRSRVLVQMRPPPEPQGLLPDDRVGVQARLRRRAALAQAPLLEGNAFLEDGRSPPQSFWIANAIALDASEEEVAALRARPDVLSVEADATVHLEPPVEAAEAPQDDAISTWGLKRMRVLEAQQAYGVDGSGIVVGILDTGFDDQHPSLAGRLLAYKNFVGDFQTPADGHGHGSHCAGTIGGGALEGMQIGVAPGVQFVAGKIFPDQGGTTTEAILAAMQWVVDPDGVPNSGDEPKLVSNSWGGGPGREVYREAVKNWLSLGIAPIFAAGNSGPRAGTVGSPADYLESFAVGATTAEATVAKFSSRGPSRWNGQTYIKPDVSAPGKAVTSVKSGGGSWTISGTSMATPHVAGLAALLAQARPDLGPLEILEAIQGSSIDRGEPGKDNHWGQGEVDAPAALATVFQGGLLEGQVRAANGAPLPFGSIQLLGEAKKISLDSAGRFRVFRPEGSYSYRAEAFGYAPVQGSVTLSSEAGTELDLSLDRVEHGFVQGKVQSQGKAIPGLVWVPETPTSPVEVGQDGSFTIELPPGSYRLRGDSFGFEPNSSESFSIQAGQTTQLDLGLEALPSTLVVGDGATSSQAKLVQDAVPGGAKLSLREAMQSMDVRFLEQFQAVVWLSGDRRRNAVSESDQALLTNYLEAGGRIVLSGQDLAISIRLSRFLRNICRTDVRGNTDRSFTVEGAGSQVSLRGGNGAGNQRSPDILEARAGAEVLLNYGSGKPAAIGARSGKGRTAVLGFGLEGVATASGRQRVVRTVLRALGLRGE